MRFVSLVAVAFALVAAAADSAYAWSWPTTGEVLRPFVFGDDPYAGALHRGVDIAGSEGESVLAPAGGRVAFAGSVPGSGRTVTIETADGYSVTLVHLGAVGVGRGDAVAEGAAVGTVGMSGDAEWPRPYVHLGVRVTADRHGYVDPLTLLPTRTPVAASGPPPAATGSVPTAPPAVIPPVVLPQPPPAAPDPPEVVAAGEVPASPTPPNGVVSPRVTGSPRRAPARRPVPPVAPTGVPSLTGGSPVEAPPAEPAPPPPPPPAPQPSGAATSPAVPVTAPAEPIESAGPVGAPAAEPKPEPPAFAADPTAVPGADPRPDPALDDARFGVSSPGAAPWHSPFATPRGAARTRRGSAVEAVGGRSGAARAHVQSVRSVRHSRRRESARPSRFEKRVALAPGRVVRNGGAVRVQARRAGGDRVFWAMRSVAPSSVLALALLVVLASCRRRDRAVDAAVGDGARKVGVAPAPKASERPIAAACRARPSGCRRRGASCGRAAGVDPIAALLAAPRPRPAPQPAFRGRSGRALAVSHRTRRAGLAEVR